MFTYRLFYCLLALVYLKKVFALFLSLEIDLSKFVKFLRNNTTLGKRYSTELFKEKRSTWNMSRRLKTVCDEIIKLV